MVDASWQQIDGGEQPVGNGTKLPHGYMSAEMTAKEAGFAYVYFSNENSSHIEFYIDDVTMTYTPGNVIQYNEFYNFGSPNANSWTRANTTGNNFSCRQVFPPAALIVFVILEGMLGTCASSPLALVCL